MKRFVQILTLVSLLFTACVQPKPVPSDSLTILGGVSNNTLFFDGTAGSQATLTFSSKLPWEILDTPGITYTPSSGEATAEGSKTTVVATINSSNNTLQPIEIGDVIIRLSRTRFTGIVAHQRPQITLENQQVTLSAEQNNQSSITFECSISDIEVVAEQDITCSAVQNIGSNKYRVNIAATKDNMTVEPHCAGYISFKVAGVAQQGKIEAIQRPAILFDRSRLLINGKADASALFTIDTPFDFTVSSSSSNLTVTKEGEKEIKVVSKTANSSNSEQKAGRVTISLAAYPSCRLDIDVWQRKALADKTMLFYFLGTSLRNDFENNLKMVESVAQTGSLADYRLIAFMNKSQNIGTMFEILYDEGTKSVIRDNLGEYSLPVQYNEAMLHDILAEMIATAPAVEYGLFVGSHGKGWLPKSVSTSSATYSTMGAAVQDIWIPAPGAAMVRHLGDSNYTQINTTEFAAALQSTDTKFSYIIFDACYMANIESAYDMRSCADYILASPCEVMASGMPYDKIVPIMAENGDTKGRLERAAKAFVDFYKEKQGIYSSACSAVITCAHIETVAQAVKRCNANMKDIDPATIQAYDGVNSSLNPTHIFFDLEDYIAKSCTDTEAVKAFQEAFSRAVTGQYHTDTFYSAYNNKANPINAYCGVTTSAPITLNPASAYIEEWRETAWYKAISY